MQELQIECPANVGGYDENETLQVTEENRKSSAGLRQDCGKETDSHLDNRGLASVQGPENGGDRRAERR